MSVEADQFFISLSVYFFYIRILYIIKIYVSVHERDPSLEDDPPKVKAEFNVKYQVTNPVVRQWPSVHSIPVAIACYWGQYMGSKCIFKCLIKETYNLCKTMLKKGN
ncbi:hypothetical protein QVD17_10925 [Tagetes erecta]|uniref:Uncharacterized protein n=1 Tax=Tagetes erecta TaxID=13708 RepID=A0AAD8L8V5_TARER|nr:hypothetical protein QVD17_10925 [Tagetes erecta]